MKISDILAEKGSHVHTIRTSESVLAAAQKLTAHNIGALAVLDGAGRLTGLISERDILRLAGRHPERLAVERVEDHMSRDLITADCEADVDEGLSVMTDHRIRHLPVVHNGKLEGIVSQGDLVKARLDDSLFETRQLTYFVMGRYPA